MEALTHQIEQQHPLVNQIRSEISRVLEGQQELVDGLLMGLFTKGHPHRGDARIGQNQRR